MPIKINDPDKQLKDELFNRTPVDPFIQRFPVFGLPFRPFFLLGALFAACVIGIWGIRPTSRISFTTFLAFNDLARS